MMNTSTAVPSAGERLPLVPAPANPITSTAEQRAACRVGLVTMPFVSAYRPSLQLGLLAALAGDAGHPVETHHLNVDFATSIGLESYEQLVHHRGRMFGDWLFSVAAFGDDAPDPGAAVLDRFDEEASALLADLGMSRAELLALRNERVPAFVEHALESVEWGRYRVVGFTSTFQQNTASFALARRIKQRYPEVVVLFGGANFEGAMGRELVAKLGFIDCAVDGEADDAFPALLDRIASGRDPLEVAGVFGRDRAKPVAAKPPFGRLDALPTPDYAEYFERALAAGVISEASRRLVYVPFESARGCWWGQKHHCTFCGLNGSTIGFRAKSAGRVLAELATLSRTCGSFRFEAVDNIMDMAYLDDLLPIVQREGLDYEFFYEIKSNLTRERIKALRDGGVVRIQPGIESLDSRVLALMRKGVTGLQNVNLLRWALYYGLDAAWNILWGFPGEQSAFYEQQVSVMRRIRHLQPPTGAGRIWMERFSPLFRERETFVADFVRAEESYRYVYPSSMDLDEIAYFFDYHLRDSLPDETYTGVRDEVREWQQAWSGEPRPTLTFWSSPSRIQIEDFRDPDARGMYTFYDDLAAIYRVCSDRPTSVSRVHRMLGRDRPLAEIEQALAEFERRGLMLCEGDRYLSLALPARRSR